MDWGPVLAAGITAAVLLAVTVVTTSSGRSQERTTRELHELDQRRDAYVALLTQLDRVDASTSGELVRGGSGGVTTPDMVDALLPTIARVELLSDSSTWAEMRPYLDVVVVRTKFVPAWIVHTDQDDREKMLAALAKHDCSIEDLTPARDRFLAAARAALG